LLDLFFIVHNNNDFEKIQVVKKGREKYNPVKCRYKFAILLALHLAAHLYFFYFKIKVMAYKEIKLMPYNEILDMDIFEAKVRLDLWLDARVQREKEKVTKQILSLVFRQDKKIITDQHHSGKMEHVRMYREFFNK
jgi:hypothetical protein